MQEAEDKMYNASTLQLSVLVANMGNLARPSVVGSKKMKSMVGFLAATIPMVARFAMQRWPRIELFCESSTLLSPVFQAFMGGNKWLAVMVSSPLP